MRNFSFDEGVNSIWVTDCGGWLDVEGVGTELER